MDKVPFTMQKHFFANDIFENIVAMGGPDLFDYMVARWELSDVTVYVEFPDWPYINEFLTEEEGHWWECFGKITDVKPGEGFYIDFYQ